MKSSSTRRVLKSVVGPALGATLGALVAGGCAKEEAKPAPTSTQPDTKTEPAPPVATPPATPPPAAPPPTAVEPEKPGAAAAPADASVEDAPARKPAPRKEPPTKKEGAKAEPHAAPPKKDVAPAPKTETPPKKTSPSTDWYAGTMLERDIRPMRPARRGTDATVHALLTGLHDPALRPLA